MKCVYKLEHKNCKEIDFETGEEICDTKMLGFFSSKEKCNESIKEYLLQPGFKDYPERFFIEKVYADIDDYNDKVGHFDKYVYYLSHEWYDGEYDYQTHFGYYSSLKKAKKAKEMYKKETEFIKYPDGFDIGKYLINEREWKEGFFSWSELDAEME